MGAFGVVPASELAAIQAAIESTFDTPVTISRNASPTDDGYGHKVAGTPVVVATCNALFDKPTGPVLAEIASRIGALVIWVVSLPLSANVKTLDIITVTATGQTFTVHIVQEPESYSPFATVIAGKVQ